MTLNEKSYQEFKIEFTEEIACHNGAIQKLKQAMIEIEKEYKEVINSLDDERLQEELQESYKQAKEVNLKAIKRLSNMSQWKRKILNYCALLNAYRKQNDTMQAEMKEKNNAYDETKEKCINEIQKQKNFDREISSSYCSVYNSTNDDF